MMLKHKKLFIALAVLILVAGIAFAQDDDTQRIEISGAPVDVMPLDAVTDAAPEVLDITATSVRVNFIGTEPLACYLVYGTDTSYGDVTNDPAMAQAAIVEHNPVMIGLEPDTEYIFRMMGTGEDGTLYVSEVYTFRTLPADDTPNDNLLSPENGAELTAVSSNFGGGADDGRWGILNAFDGNPATEWSSDGDGDDAYFEVQLGETYQINAISYHSRAMTDGSAITTSFTVTTDSGEMVGPFDLPGTENTHTFAFDEGFTASSLRFDVASSTGGNTGVIDVAVYGEPAE
jgi:hypothetical protein